MSDEEQARPPKHLRLLIAAIVIILIVIAFALSWLTMPRVAKKPHSQVPSSPSTTK